MAGRTIVLAHGVLGFGNPTGLPTFINYFNGGAAHLRRRGHNVIAPQVNPVGSVAQRGDQLAAAILAIFKQAPAGEKVHIIAHSMGGLDARHAITHVPGVAERVATLVTIGTPHRGSPVADAIANRTDPLFEHIPPFVVHQLERNVGALNDLTTGFGQHFDDATLDMPGVRYVEVAGDASRGGHELILFQLAAGSRAKSTTASSQELPPFGRITNTSPIGPSIMPVKLAGAFLCESGICRSCRPQPTSLVTMRS